MNQEQNNLNSNNFNSQGNNEISSNQSLNTLNFNNAFDQKIVQNSNTNGTNFASQITNESNSRFYSQNFNEPQPVTPQKNKKNSIFFIIIAIFVVISIILGIFLFKNNSKINFGNKAIDWTSYEVEINNVKYTLPIDSARSLTKTGLILEAADSQKTLATNLISSCEMKDKNGNSIFTYSIINKTGQDRLYHDLKIVSISQDKYNLENSDIAIIFPGNLKVGMKTTEQDIKKILGEPSEIKYEEYKYKEGDISISLNATKEEWDEYTKKLKDYNINGYSHTIMEYYTKNEVGSHDSYYGVYLIDGYIYSLTLNNKKS